ncbi:PTS mannose/fructose/sorbose/N-acetylgalactosamine transporter subunit IIC [Eubacterium multiforme]|uniref:Mannose/fructose/N-acetylgalactosamine-specific phosphotransferase system component IIC n=1 Tax=Eubacterium multiforme TaxID=83339 RepID=A0ABT9UPM7_9FIRM|nr:PTS sugar transporter subunit IIC [Eubacterium multiforme]MDQ0148600.1 mannose/fructose/N-acetylgalactosamine-specific phosphotransferase system component IIC [Eubacterium multiforme]
MKDAILIGLINVIGYLDYFFGGIMINRPIVLAPLVGLALGDLRAGIIMGATLELVFMGVITIGAATPPDTVTGSVLGTAFAILTGSGAEIALALALPIAMLSQAAKIGVNVLRSSFMPKVMEYAEDGDIKGMERIHWICYIIMLVVMFTIAFISILIGSDAMKAFVDSIPKSILEGMKIASGLLPAVGFGLLLKVMYSKRLAIFYYFGFLLAAYFNLPIMGIACLGIVVAVILEFVIDASSGNKSISQDSNEDKEALFDD